MIEYKDESKKFADYKSDTPRKISKDISLGKIPPQHIGIKSIEVKKQELISHIQNWQETFNNQEAKAWKVRFRELTEQLI